MIANSNVQTSVSQERVWRILTDYPHWHHWDKEIRSVKMKNEVLSANSEGDFIEKKGNRSHFRVTRLQPDFTYTLETKLPFAQVYTRRILGYHNNKTIISNEVWIEGPLSGFWTAILGKKYERQLREQNALLLQMVEH